MAEEDQRLKMAIISGASHAMQFKDENPTATSDEVIKHVSDNASHILDKIDEEL